MRSFHSASTLDYGGGGVGDPPPMTGVYAWGETSTATAGVATIWNNDVATEFTGGAHEGSVESVVVNSF